MIISLTGKPCSGKGEVGKILSECYGFKHISTGEIFRETAIKLGYHNLNTLTPSELDKLDKTVDSALMKMGKKHIKENLVMDSRLAWHFIPNSFKVFLDVTWQEAGKRLVGANRESEQVTDIKSAIKNLKQRWESENSRYQQLYNVDNLHRENYNLVINTANKTPEEVANLIYEEYLKYTKNK